MDLSLPRGIRDVEPEEYERHERVFRTFEDVARLFNFRMMEPAPLEHLSTLRVKSGEDIDKEIYSFKDKGGRDVALRFDLTVGLTRYVCSRRDLKPPVKLASIGGVWRYDEPQHARYRWFTQWDLEVFGPPSVGADADVVEASSRLFDRLGIEDALTQVGDRRVIQEFITKRLKADSPEKAVELMRALDKSQKRTSEELTREYTKKGFSPEDLKSLFEFGNTKGSPDDVVSRLRELKLDSAAELESLNDALRDRGVRRLEYNLSIVRGIDYYTGVVFEVVDERRPDLGSLCGGGRFDALPRLFGRPDLSSTGAAGGIEREVLSMEWSASRDPLVFVAWTGSGARSAAARALSELRGNGVRAEGESEARPLGRQLERASSLGAGWTLILGEKEVASGKVTLRNMAGRTEERVSFEEALKRIAAR